MTDVQFWSIIITMISTLGGQQIVSHLLGRGKFRSDDATALRAELRADNRAKDEKIKALEKRIDDLEQIVDNFRMLRVDMYRVLHENNIPKDVLAQLRILEAITGTGGAHGARD